MANDKPKVDDRIDRRTILQVVSANTAAVGLIGTVAGANKQGDELHVTEEKGSERRRLIDKARQSEEFRQLRKELITERNFVPSGNSVRVFTGEQNEDDSFQVVSFPLEHPDRDNIQNADMCVVIDSDESIRTASGSIGSAVPDESVLTQLTSFTVEEGSMEVKTEQISVDLLKESEDVTTQSTAYCSGCKELYSLACTYGCFTGWTTLCVLYTGGLGLIWCEGAVAAICDYIDDNSCDPTAEVACEIIGYC